MQFISSQKDVPRGTFRI